MATTNICESLIKSDIKFSCNDLVSRGLEADGLIINRSDVDFSATVWDSTNPNIIKTLVLKSGKKAFEIVQMGNTPFAGVTTTLQTGTYRNTWQHEIPIAVLANTPEVSANIIDGLANGKFVVILRNIAKGEDGDSEFQIYGYAQGLTASEGTNEKYSEDTDGGWLITLQEASAPKSAIFFFDGTTESTEAKYESLKTPAE